MRLKGRALACPPGIAKRPVGNHQERPPRHLIPPAAREARPVSPDERQLQAHPDNRSDAELPDRSSAELHEDCVRGAAGPDQPDEPHADDVERGLVRQALVCRQAQPHLSLVPARRAAGAPRLHPGRLVAVLRVHAGRPQRSNADHRVEERCDRRCQGPPPDDRLRLADGLRVRQAHSEPVREQQLPVREVPALRPPWRPQPQERLKAPQPARQGRVR